MKILALLLLMPICAHADSCAVDAIGPCTPSQAQKDEILKLIERARQKYDDRNGAATERNEAYARRDFIATEEKQQKVLDYDEEMNSLLAQALAKTMEYYHVGPTATEGNVVSPKRDPQDRGDWSAGINAHWKPEIIFADSDVHQMYGPKEGPHYGGGPLDPNAIAGMTYPDGTVKIMAQNLFDAEAHSNSGEIAAIIDHEAQHFNDLLTSGFSSMEECEMRAYAAELRDADIFELTDEQKNGANGIRARRDHYESAFKAGIQNGNLSSYFPDENAERDLSIQYDKAQDELRKFNAKMDEVHRFADEQRIETAKAQVLADAINVIHGYWFEPDYRENGNVFIGFRNVTNGWPSRYTITHEMTLDQLTVGVTFARTCLGITVLGRSPKSAIVLYTSRAIAITDRHWNDPGFKEDAQLSVLPEEQARCMNYLHDHWTAPMTEGYLERILVRARVEYQKAVDDQWRQDERERREREDGERERRHRNGGSGRTNPGGGSNSGPRAPIQCGFGPNGAYCH